MNPITVYPKSKEQEVLFEQLAKALKIPFKVAKNKNREEADLPGEDFKKSIEEGKKAFENGEMNQFTEIDRKDLWE